MAKCWTNAELETVRSMYPHVKTTEIATLLNRKVGMIYQCADRLGVKKSAEYLNSPAACRLRRGDDVGWAHRYPKGHVPANKGLRRPGWGPGRMKATQFKKGTLPHTWRPIGTTRLSKDGYVQRKVTDTGYPPRDWKGEHIILWESVNGEVPKGHAVVFKDGNKTNVTIGNLELLSRAELMKRNTYHRYPKEIARAIQLVGAISRQINKRGRNEKQDVRPTQSSL